MIELIIALVAISLSIFLGFYLSYYGICLWYLKKYSGEKTALQEVNPVPVSIIIPVYNEVKVLKYKTENLRALDYPKDKLEIVFVDGGSTDGSIAFLENLAKSQILPVKVVFQGERKGFNSAVRAGFAETTGEVIIITGAETEYPEDSLKVIIRHFSNPQIGAVTGRQVIKNVDDGLSPKVEIAYRGLYDFLREAESHIDSPFDLKGEISAARREIVQALVDNPTLNKKGCIDACFSFQGKLDGYQTVYDPSAIYYELSPKLMRESFKQQSRRAATLIENMLVFKKMILNKKFGAFGMLIMPAHFLMLLVLPFLFMIATVGLVFLTAFYPSNYLLLLITVGGVLIFVLSAKAKAFVKAQFALLLATLKLLKGVETQKFERLDSARPTETTVSSEVG